LVDKGTVVRSRPVSSWATARPPAIPTCSTLSLVVNVADNLASVDPALSVLYSMDSQPIPDGSDTWQQRQRRSIPLPDKPPRSFDVLQALDASWIVEELANHLARTQYEVDQGAVLVHCVAGMNRSATVVCMVLMRLHSCTARASLLWLQRARPIVHPYPVYQRGLLALQKRLTLQLSDVKLADQELDLLASVATGKADGVSQVPLATRGTLGPGEAPFPLWTFPLLDAREHSCAIS